MRKTIRTNNDENQIKCIVGKGDKAAWVELTVLWFVLLLLVICFASAIWVVFKLVKTGIAGLDVAIQVSIITFLGTCLGFLMSKRYEVKCRIFEQRMLNRRMAYEHVISFLFECQQRAGCNVDVPNDEIGRRCLKTTQLVMMWASEKVQVEWERYLAFRHSGKGGQKIVYDLLAQICWELGNKYRASYFASSRLLNFFYGCNGTPICYDEDSKEI